MPKDRSFAHRIHQSNIDRQRNADYFLSRPSVAVKPAPKADYWQRVKTFFKKAQEFHTKHEGTFMTLNAALILWIIWSVFGDSL